MTIEEAIETIKTAIAEVEWEYPMNYAAAFEVAIKALEQQPILDKIRAEIDSYCSDNRDRNDGLYIAMRIIDKYRESEDKECKK